MLRHLKGWRDLPLKNFLIFQPGKNSARAERRIPGSTSRWKTENHVIEIEFFSREGFNLTNAAKC